MSLLSVKNLSFAYGRRAILRDVSVSLEAGEIVALIGPNGSGKSTLIRTLLGELKRAAGEISWFERALDEWPRRELAKRIAYLPQHPTAPPEQSVGDVLRLGRAPYWRAFGVESIEDEQIVHDVASRLDLLDSIDRPMDALSGGQQQRVFLGRCLVQRPSAILLDEPNTYLDMRHQVSLASTIRKLARDEKLGVLMASHDLNLAAAIADRMILLDAGAIASAGSCNAVLRDPALSKTFGVQLQVIDRVGPPVVVPILGPELETI